MWQQAAAFILLIFVLRHVEGIGNLPLLHAGCNSRRLHPLDKRLLVLGFCP